MPGARHDTPAFWDTDASGLAGMGMKGSPSKPGSPQSRTGKQGKGGNYQGDSDMLSYEELRAMGLSEEEIQMQLSQAATSPGQRERAQTAPGGPSKATQRSGSPARQGGQGSGELTAAELRAMGLSEDEIQSQLAAIPQPRNDPLSPAVASQLSPAELRAKVVEMRAMGMTDEEIRAQTKGLQQGKGKGKGKSTTTGTGPRSDQLALPGIGSGMGTPDRGYDANSQMQYGSPSSPSHSGYGAPPSGTLPRGSSPTSAQNPGLAALDGPGTPRPPDNQVPFVL